ncbi:MAG: MCE family protein [Bacteroidaceae bacterium]|nr:MCE family protein [Bacteroidaceae bacterium]MBR5001981.1 MCE family protein [Bacteroidaceae bacterium]
MKKFWTKEVKIGLTAIICIVLMFIVIQFLKGIDVTKPANYYTIAFDNVSDVMVSTPVTVNGYKVGVVHEMQYDYESNNKVLVMINLDKELRIPRDSKVSISKTIMGNASVVIDLNPYVSEYYKSGDTIEGTAGSDLMASLGGMMPEITAIVQKIDSVLSGVNTLVNDPALLASLQRLDNITANLENMTGSLEQTMQKDLPHIIDNVTAITNNVDTLTQTLNTLPLEATLAQVSTMLANIEQATAQLNKCDNTAGLLLNDQQLYESLSKSVNSLDSLLIDIRQNPKKYINVKVF